MEWDDAWKSPKLLVEYIAIATQFMSLIALLYTITIKVIALQKSAVALKKVALAVACMFQTCQIFVLLGAFGPPSTFVFYIRDILLGFTAFLLGIYEVMVFSRFQSLITHRQWVSKALISMVILDYVVSIPPRFLAYYYFDPSGNSFLAQWANYCVFLFIWPILMDFFINACLLKVIIRALEHRALLTSLNLPRLKFKLYGTFFLVVAYDMLGLLCATLSSPDVDTEDEMRTNHALVLISDSSLSLHCAIVMSFLATVIRLNELDTKSTSFDESQPS